MILLKVTTVNNIFSATIGFLITGLNFQDSVCDVCHDLTMFCLNISDFVIITVKGVDYHCINHYISKSEAMHLLETSVLDDPRYT